MKFASAENFEWLVVDNDSGDNSHDEIIQRFPFVHWIEMGYNAGFARANNAGIKASSGDAVLLLNPDTLVIDDAIDTCFNRLMQSGCVACSVQLVNPDGSNQISGNYFMKGGINHLLPLPYYGRFLKRVAVFLKSRTPHVDQPGAEEFVDWINGAFLMVKRSGIDKTGLMDEDFFLFAEETEWCSRLGKAGRLCIFGDIKMIHLQGEITNEKTGSDYKGYNNLFDQKGLQLMVSNHLRIRKQYGIGWFLFQLLNVSVAIPVFMIGHLVTKSKKFPGEPGWKELKGLTRNVLKIWRLTPLIIRNKPHFYKMF